MPKIIENLKDHLIAEAERQIEEFGYGAMTIRSVAKACCVGVGTVYNYFPSKEALIANYLLKDWTACISAIGQVADLAETPQPVLACIYRQLVEFAERHQGIFRDEAATAGFAGSFSQYHNVLRSQLAAPLQKFCNDTFTAQFVAESLLTWTMSGKSFNEIYEIVKKLF
jgi:AcrR family transcriptional regulator